MYVISCIWRRLFGEFNGNPLFNSSLSSRWMMSSSHNHSWGTSSSFSSRRKLWRMTVHSIKSKIALILFLSSVKTIRMFRSHGNLAFHIPIVCSLITRVLEWHVLKFSCSWGIGQLWGFLNAGTMYHAASNAESPNRYSRSAKYRCGEPTNWLFRKMRLSWQFPGQPAR